VTYGERVEREPITGVCGQSPQWGPGAEPLVAGSGGEAPLKLKGFGKTTSKYVHEFSTFTTYIQRLVSYFADKKLLSVTRLFEVREALNPTHWDGNFSLFQLGLRFFKTSHILARMLCCCNLATWLFANSSPHKPTQACPILVSYSNK